MKTFTTQFIPMKSYTSKRIINKRINMVEQFIKLVLDFDCAVFPNLPMFYAVFVFILCSLFDVMFGK